MQSASSQNGASAAQIESNGKAAHAAVVQAVSSGSREDSYSSNGTAVLQNGAASANGNGSVMVEELKDAATIVSVTENGAVGADSEQNGAWDPAWADPCEVGHLEACAADRWVLFPPRDAGRTTTRAPCYALVLCHTATLTRSLSDHLHPFMIGSLKA